MTYIYFYLAGVCLACAFYWTVLYKLGKATVLDIVLPIVVPFLSWGAVAIAVCAYIIANHDEVVWRKK